MEIAELRDEIVSERAKAAFDVISAGFSAASGFDVRTHEQGFLNSLRIFRGEEFCFALTPNDEWVLAYIRKPELRREVLSFEKVKEIFPEARMTKAGEITLRIKEKAEAEQWLALALSA